MMTTVQGVLSSPDNEPQWRSFAAWKQGVEELEELTTNIAALWKTSADKKGPAADKAQALQLLGDLAYEVAGGVHACAVKSGNDDLAARTDLSRTDITDGRDATVVTRCQTLLETASGVLESLGEYQITQAKLNTFKKRIEAFKVLLSKPRQKVATSSAATNQLPNLFRQASTLPSQRLDRLAVQFKETQPDLYAAYKVARVVVKPGSAQKDSNVVPLTNTAPEAKAA